MEFLRWYGRLLVAIFRLRWVVSLLRARLFWSTVSGTIAILAIVLVPLLIWDNSLERGGIIVSIWWLIPAWTTGPTLLALSYYLGTKEEN